MSNGDLSRRYAKQKVHNANIEAAGTSDHDWVASVDMFGDARGIVYFEPAAQVIVAPGRYSSVRKVIFHIGIRGWTVAANACSLGVMPSSTLNTGRALATVSIAQNALVGGTSSVLPRPTPIASSAIGYDHFGSTVTIPTNQADGDVAMATVEFDRLDLDPGVQDFFNDWDNIADLGNEVYAAFFPLVIPTVFAGRDIDCGGFGMTIVQEPAPNNRATTWHIIRSGWVFDPAAATTAYASPEGEMRWTFNQNRWDGLVAINGWGWGVPDAAGGITVRCRKFDTATDTTGDTVFEDTFATNGTNLAYVRTRDFLANLLDGRTYSIEEHHNGALGGARRRFTWYLEIVQETFTKTTTYFDAQTNSRTDPKGGGGLWAETFLTGCFFDPTWFQSIPDSSFLARMAFFMQRRVIGAHANTQMVRRDTDLIAVDDNNAGGAGTGFRSATATIVHQHATALTGDRDYSEQTLNPANDPMNLAGTCKLYWGSPNPDVWSSDLCGPVGLFYVFLVPETEVSQLGPLFPLDAFNPEGCAATAAGLGDPGVLVISNGSTLPQKYDPVAGQVDDAGVPTPFEGEVPSFIVTNNATGLTDGDYVYRYTFRNCCTGKESDPNPDDILVTIVGSAPAAKVTLSFAGVRIPGDPQICEICVYRTVEGGAFPVLAKVGCFDPAATELFEDTTPDVDLDFLEASLSITNAPMPCVPYIVEFRNRLWGAGDIPMLSPAGTVSVVEGSDEVEGDFDTQWTRCLEGKFIQLEGDCRAYEIERVLPPDVGTSPAIGRLKLVDLYEGQTQTGALYTICGRANRVYYSEPLEPECWPVVNFIDVDPGDGDRITGLGANFDRLVVCKRNKTYVLTFREIPALEVIVPTLVSSDVGCVGPRTFAQAEVGTIWLADRGLALFDGRGVAHVPESVDVNDIFTDEDNPRFVRRDRNGRVIDAVGVFYPKREQYLLLLPTVQTDRGCNLMLVWDIKGQNITLCEFCQEFQSMMVARDEDGIERVYLGDTNGFVWIFDLGHTDGVGTPGNTGTVRGLVTSAGVDDNGACFFVDSTATFIEGGLPELAGLSGIAGLSGAVADEELGLAGVCVFLRAPGETEWREPATVYAATQTRVYVTPCWGSDVPEAGWEYMLGPINFEALFKVTDFSTLDTKLRDWRHILVHEIEEFASDLKVELRPDFQLTDPGEGTIVGPDGELGGRRFLLDYGRGRQVQPVGRDIHSHMQVRMTNFAPEEPIRILNHSLAVEPQAGK